MPSRAAFTMMKTSVGSRTWFLGLIALFLICNLVFWSYNPHGGCDPSGNCTYFGKKTSVPKEPAKPPAPAEAKLDPVNVLEIQPIKRPSTYIPASHPRQAKDLELVAPTSDEITIRLKDGAVGYARRNEFWQMGLINSKPDVLIPSEGHINLITEHYNREHRIYTLMKWILRVYRRDPSRTHPLLMVDAGSNHGLFSMVAGASGAHAIAFEPQVNLRSIIALGGRLNRVSERVRILPFGVLDQFRKIAMAQFEVKDGGIAHLDLGGGSDAKMLTHTIRLDCLPRFDMLFGRNHTDAEKSLINKPEEIDPGYAAALYSAGTTGGLSTIDSALTLHNPIHFLKIDVEGFELHALESASRLFEAGLVEHAILEFGPPNRWDVTVPKEANMSRSEIRKRTTTHAKELLHKVAGGWNMDIYLLPAIGWESTVKWMLKRGVSFSNISDGNQVVHKLKSWDFDQQPLDNDEFEQELRAKNRLITEVIPLRPDVIDSFVDDLESIGELYLWFAKRGSHPAVRAKMEL